VQGGGIAFKISSGSPAVAITASSFTDNRIVLSTLRTSGNYAEGGSLFCGATLLCRVTRSNFTSNSVTAMIRDPATSVEANGAALSTYQGGFLITASRFVNNSVRATSPSPAWRQNLKAHGGAVAGKEVSVI
jgi:hypothetical protein